MDFREQIKKQFQKNRIRNFNHDPESFGYLMYFTEPIINIVTGQKIIWLIEYKVYKILINDLFQTIYPS